MNTKSKQLDQFFTDPKVSVECTAFLLKSIKKYRDKLFIEPSAGQGCFIHSVRSYGLKIRGYDIDPQIDGVKYNDFLKDTIKTGKKRADVVMVGNPPFGKRGNTALQFVIKSFEYAETVGFILPNNFAKFAMQARLPEEVKVLAQMPIPKNAFYTVDKDGAEKKQNIGCVFMVLTVKNIKNDQRIRTKPPIEHPHFILYQYNNTKGALKHFSEDWDIALFCQGYGDYGDIKTSARQCDKRKHWLLVKAKNQAVLKRIKSIDLEALAQKNTTTPGFRKADFVNAYIKTL